MEKKELQGLAEELRGFHLPRYAELTDVGLYLEQTTEYINGILRPLGCVELTGSMIRNYVKKGLVANPVKKRYSADQIAHLICIAVLKQVLSLENLGILIERKSGLYDNPTAYNYFCTELENVLDYVFGRKPEMDAVGVERTAGEKLMLRNTIITVAHKVYLTRLCAVLREQEEGAKATEGQA